MKFKRLIYIAILVVMIASTVVPVFFFQPKGEPISATGTVQLINLEGGFYGIAGDDGLNYDPINLENEFQQDGLRLRFEARIRTDLVSTRQWGTIIEITGIEKLP